MQRVVSINLNGNAYQIEENGYTALFAYLDATESALRDNPDRAQKLADLERLIAEKCQAYLGPHKTVITSAEIDGLLRDLDPVPAQPAAEPAASSSSSSSTTSSTSSQSSSPRAGHKQLYQIREGAMISGVCMGLSEFLHVDVTVIRILFVIFALVTSGWGILVYGVLMFLLPRVDTRAAASDGATPGTMPPHHWPWDEHGWPWGPPRTQGQTPSAPGSGSTRQDWREQRREWREQRRAARLAHPWPMFGTLSMIVFLMFGFFWLSFWTRGHFFFGWPFFWGFPHWFGIIIFFMMLRLIFMPFRMARWHAYGPYGPYASPHYAWVSMWNGLMWFAVMIFAVWAAYHYIPDVHEFFRDFQTSWHDSGFHV